MDKLRVFFGPANVGRGGGSTERNEADRAADLKKLKVRRVTNPDGSSYLVTDEEPEN